MDDDRLVDEDDELADVLDADTEEEVGMFEEERSVVLEERAEVPDKDVTDAEGKLRSSELRGALVVGA